MSMHFRTRRLDATGYMTSMYSRSFLLKVCQNRSITICVRTRGQKRTVLYMIWLVMPLCYQIYKMAPRNIEAPVITTTKITILGILDREAAMPQHQFEFIVVEKSSHRNASFSLSCSTPTSVPILKKKCNTQCNYFSPHSKRRQSPRPHSSFPFLHAARQARNVRLSAWAPHELINTLEVSYPSVARRPRGYHSNPYGARSAPNFMSTTMRQLLVNPSNTHPPLQTRTTSRIHMSLKHMRHRCLLKTRCKGLEDGEPRSIWPS